MKSELDSILGCVEYGSISKAAERIGVNQPSLTKIIQKVENDLGKKLFVRSQRGIRPTPYGSQLVESILRLKAVWENELLSLSANEQVFSGKLKIGCHNSVANDCFPKIILPLSRKFPAVEFAFDFDRSPEITRKLTKMEIDIGLVVNNVKNSDLVARHIKDEFIGIWTNDDASGSVLLYNPAMFMSEKLMKKYAKHRLIQIQDYEVIGNMIRKGGCRGVLPSTVAERFRLQQEGGRLYSVNLSLVWHKDRFKSPGQQAILKEIVQLLRTE